MYAVWSTKKTKVKSKVKSGTVGEGGESPLSDCICTAKPKKTIFTNGQFTGHLIFTKKYFFHPDKQELYFFEKKGFFFFF